MMLKQSSHPGVEVFDKAGMLLPERLGEVEDSVDFMSGRDDDRRLSRAAMAASEPVLNAVWDNPEDAEYDRL